MRWAEAAAVFALAFLVAWFTWNYQGPVDECPFEIDLIVCPEVWDLWTVHG